jgi:Chromosome segregation ATPases
MRLHKIKLSGFKSFVDPTTLIIPGNLIGIVGPNGCGKSNIIDAVMWVMGESSAKHLRGDALTDVIFNGSNSRNPVGQASVELIFDNTEKKLGGQYASYDEISIKRYINRDAISVYYLNGVRCRRRDIQAIFLGTGLGPRSYAIIEQGMISRLIEARPEELRIFIEEAAGISKYRERRRETENRIRNTRENITRLNDIREELDTQLKHLQRQANAAERYQSLKKVQRRLEAELHALHWRVLKQQSLHEEEEVRKQETRAESAIAELRRLENGIATAREELTAANENFGAAQSRFYRIGADISQLEQKIQHMNEKIASAGNDLCHAEQEETAAREQLQQDKNKLTVLLASKASLTPRLQGSRLEGDQAYKHLNETEQSIQYWQEEWEAVNTTVADYEHRKEVARIRLEHLELSMEAIEQRQLVLKKELQDTDRDSLNRDMKVKREKLENAEKELARLTVALDAMRQQFQDKRKVAQGQMDKLNEQRLRHQRLSGRYASLEALQQSALGQDQENVVAWLKKAKLTQQPKLAQQIKVEPVWSHAVEIVLGQFLQHVCVNDINTYAKELDHLETGQLGIVGAELPSASQSKKLIQLSRTRLKGHFR